jgi:hypothetical protein
MDGETDHNEEGGLVLNNAKEACTIPANKPIDTPICKAKS